MTNIWVPIPTTALAEPVAHKTEASFRVPLALPVFGYQHDETVVDEFFVANPREHRLKQQRPSQFAADNDPLAGVH